MDHMENLTRLLSRLGIAAGLLALTACAGDPLSGARRVVPTARPDLRVTPAPAQNVQATATAYALQIIPTPTPQGLYVVKPGDTLSKIADEHATTVDEIMAANNLSDPNLIEVGQRLTVPSGEVTPEGTGEPPSEAPASTEEPVSTEEPAATAAP
jgi:LysM repeat protein